MAELVVLVGLQASGKSTFCRERLATHALVSKDRFPNNRNKARRQRVLVEENLRAAKDVALDNTNPTRVERAEMIALARSLGASVRCVWFAASLESCLERNAGRAGRARVPDVGLQACLARMEKPRRDEGFDSLAVATMREGGFDVRAWEEADEAG